MDFFLNPLLPYGSQITTSRPRVKDRPLYISSENGLPVTTEDTKPSLSFSTETVWTFGDYDSLIFLYLNMIYILSEVKLI